MPTIEENYVFERLNIPIIPDPVTFGSIYNFSGYLYNFWTSLERIALDSCPDRPDEIHRYNQLVQAETVIYRTGEYKVGLTYGMDGIRYAEPITITLDAGTEGAKIEVFSYLERPINFASWELVGEIGIGETISFMLPELQYVKDTDFDPFPTLRNILFRTSEEVTAGHFEATRFVSVREDVFMSNYVECMTPAERGLTGEMALKSLTTLANHTQPLGVIRR